MSTSPPRSPHPGPLLKEREVVNLKGTIFHKARGGRIIITTLSLLPSREALLKEREVVNLKFSFMRNGAVGRTVSLPPPFSFRRRAGDEVKLNPLQNKPNII